MTDTRMGHALREYKPRWNAHRLINALLTRPRLANLPGAIVTTQKRMPDVSKWQGEIDWDLMRTMTDSVIIRCSHGITTDPFFRQNWMEAKRVGMRRGVYHFYEDTSSPGAQANKVYQLIRSDPPELEVFADWESVYGGSFGGLRNVVAMMESIERQMGALKCTGLYTGFYFFTGNSNPIGNASQYAYLRERPLWLAWYVDNPAVVRIPAPWQSLTFWQFGTPVEGHLYGVQSLEIDMNYFNGTQADFNMRYGDGIEEPPPSGPVRTKRVNVYSDGSILEV